MDLGHIKDVDVRNVKMTTIDLVTSGLMNFNDNKEPNMSRSVVTTQVTSTPTISSYTFTSPTARIGHSIIYVGGTPNYLYMFGGRDESGNYYNHLWQLNLTTGQWIMITPTGTLPEARSEHAMFYYNGLIYIYGGWNGTTYYDDLYSYNPASGNAWTPVTTTGGSTSGTTSILRYGFGHAIYGANLYVFGGMVAGVVTNSVLILSLSTFVWTLNSNGLPLACYRLSAVTNSVGADIYLYGGATTTTSLSGLLRFTISTGVFTTVGTNGTNPGKCAGYAFFIVGTVIYVYGGYTTGGTTNNSIFTCDTSLTTPTWTNPSITSPPSARCLCGSASNGGTVYIDDGATSSALTTSLDDTWSITLIPSLVAQLIAKQITMPPNTTTFTLAGVVFTVFKDTANSNHAALRWTVPIGVKSGLIISLSSLKIVV